MILDTPLKSIEEIIDFRGSTEELERLAKNYRDNHLRPIDSIESLRGLSLDILLHFQEKDKILSNRDDFLYIEKLQAIQPNTNVIRGTMEGIWFLIYLYGKHILKKYAFETEFRI